METMNKNKKETFTSFTISKEYFDEYIKEEHKLDYNMPKEDWEDIVMDIAVTTRTLFEDYVLNCIPPK